MGLFTIVTVAYARKVARTIGGHKGPKLSSIIPSVIRGFGKISARYESHWGFRKIINFYLIGLLVSIIGAILYILIYSIILN
jgi:cobalamin synthase